MAGNISDKYVSELPLVSLIKENDALVMDQDGVAKKVTGSIIADYSSSTASSKVSEMATEYFDTNVIADLSGKTITTVKGTWRGETFNYSLPSGTGYISVYVGEITYDTAVPANRHVMVTLKNGSTSVSSTNIYKNCQANIVIPSNVNNIDVLVYTNTTVADNTTAHVSKLAIYSGTGADAELSIKDSTRTGIADTNALIHYKNKTFIGLKGTWSFATKRVSLPSGTTFLTMYVGNIVYDNVALSGNYIRLSYEKNGAAVGTATYVNTLSYTYTLTVPSEADTFILDFYVNTTSADNTKIVIDELYVLADEKSLHKTLDGNVFVGGQSILDISKSIEDSKNVFRASFARGSINSSGAFVASPTTTQFTATPDLIPVKPNTEYTLSWKLNLEYVVLNVYGYNSNGTFISDGTEARDEWAKRVRQIRFVTRANTYFIRIQFWSNTSTSYDAMVPEDVQLEIGGAATSKMSNINISSMVDPNLVEDIRFKIPDYYFTGGYLENKVSAIRQYMLDAAGNYDAFFFITDMHYEWNQMHSPALIRYLAKRLNITKLFNGGDMHNDWGRYYDDETLQLIRSAFNGDIYNVVGNHEYHATYMTEAAVWFFLNSMHNNIVVGDPGRSYYYVDNTAQKIRYIILNSYSNAGTDAVATFEQAQQTWFSNTALNLPSGWGAVIFIHGIYEIGNDRNPVRWKIQNVTDQVCSIIDNYSGSGEIIALFAGHAHRDKLTSTPGGVPIFITTCDKNGIYYVTPDDPDILTPRDSGTKEEQAFDVCIIDKRNRKITAVRVGAPAYNGVDDQLGVLAEYRQMNFKSR